MQLAGSPEQATFDLNALSALGVKLVGKLAAIRDGRALFSGSLRNKCELADLKLGRLLDTIDQWATENAFDKKASPSHRFEPTAVEASPPLGIDLSRGQIKTIIWATGYRPDFRWIDLPVTDEIGWPFAPRGISRVAGLYFVGMPLPEVASELHIPLGTAKSRLHRSLGVMRTDPSIFARMWENAEFFRKGVERIGYQTCGTKTPIIPLFIGSEARSLRMCCDSMALGMFATPAVYPAVPKGHAVIRTSVTAAHNREHLEMGLSVLKTLAERYPLPNVDPATLPPARDTDLAEAVQQALLEHGATMEDVTAGSV